MVSTVMPNLYGFSFSGDPTKTTKVKEQYRPTSSYTEAIAQKFQEIKALYSSDLDPEVICFLQNNHVLFDLVIEAGRELYRLFGANASLQLVLDRDPEDDWEELFAIVAVNAVNVDPEQVRKNLHTFDEEWFLARQNVAAGLFNVDIMFCHEL